MFCKPFEGQRPFAVRLCVPSWSIVAFHQYIVVRQDGLVGHGKRTSTFLSGVRGGQNTCKLREGKSAAKKRRVKLRRPSSDALTRR